MRKISLIILLSLTLSAQTVQSTYRFVVVDAQGRNVAKFTVAQLRTWLIGSGLGVGGGSGSTYIDGETPTGAIDGVNRIFTLSQIPTGPPLIFRNGVLQEPANYARTGKVITFNTGVFIPQTGDLITAWYRY